MQLMFIQLYQSKYCYCSSFITKNTPSVKTKTNYKKQNQKKQTNKQNTTKQTNNPPQAIILFKNCEGRNRYKQCCKATVPHTHFMQQIIIICGMIISFCVLAKLYGLEHFTNCFCFSFPFLNDLKS